MPAKSGFFDSFPNFRRHLMRVVLLKAYNRSPYTVFLELEPLDDPYDRPGRYGRVTG